MKNLQGTQDFRVMPLLSPRNDVKYYQYVLPQCYVPLIDLSLQSDNVTIVGGGESFRFVHLSLFPRHTSCFFTHTGI